MPLGRSKPRLSREQALSARPLRLAADAKFEKLPGGGGRLTVRVSPPRWSRWLFRLSDGILRTFELDAVGVYVWEQCDGKTTVERLVRTLSEEFRLNLREAEVSTLQFLQTLASRGLIGLEVPRQKKDR